MKSLFPSPVGELHFSIRNRRKRTGLIVRKVSVPCRGTTFLNFDSFTQDNRLASFRPLSGNYISQCKQQIKNNVFPCFRPLSGNYISQCESFNDSYKYDFSFPSPVGELHFSIPSLQSRHQSGLMVGIAWEKYFWKNK